MTYERDRLAGALWHTQCPNCALHVGAEITNEDGRWLDVRCPGCDHEWTEEK